LASALSPERRADAATLSRRRSAPVSAACNLARTGLSAP
jgi:hypothetical protein